MPPRRPRAAPVLEQYYNVRQATVRLGLATEADDDKRGQKWLRDGVNKHTWPARRMAGQLMFSDSDLAWIAEECVNKRHGSTGKRRARRSGPPRNRVSQRLAADTAAPLPTAGPLPPADPENRTA